MKYASEDKGNTFDEIMDNVERYKAHNKAKLSEVLSAAATIGGLLGTIGVLGAYELGTLTMGGVVWRVIVSTAVMVAGVVTQNVLDDGEYYDDDDK